NDTATHEVHTHSLHDALPILSINKIATTEVINTESVEIRMPQMANSALSENWLLKYLGDYHWQLLSKAYKLKSSEFADENGNRLDRKSTRLNSSHVKISYAVF